MALYEKLKKLDEAKAKIVAQKKCLHEQRKYEIAQLAEKYGLLTLPDDEIRLAFENLVYNHNKC